MKPPTIEDLLDLRTKNILVYRLLHLVEEKVNLH
ncbi:hypothetical protein SAMN05421787_101828 [Virgibacillus pantothenticus]|nr:hypothetical protein SAMN05421787_101828 [Virgibacillus pantothenticus]